MEFDVVIVGASSSGLRAAEGLAHSGKSVAVFERKKKFELRQRTLIVTGEFSNLMGEMLGDVKLHEINMMVVASPNFSAEIRLRDPDLIVERKEIGNQLAGKAKRAGAELFLGHCFEGLEGDKDDAILHFGTTGDNQIKVRCKEAVIGADGAQSHVGRAVGIPPPITVPILQAEAPLPGDWNPKVSKVWFNVGKTRYFFWLIPASDHNCVIGLIGDGRGNKTRGHLNSFAQQLNISPSSYQGAYVALYHPRLRPWGRVAKTPVYLIGDAAGHVKVTTIGGSVTGMEGAQAAVRAIVNGTSYERELVSLKRELNLHWLIRKLLDRLDNHGYDGLISSLSVRVKEFLSEHSRDSMAPVYWRLPFIEPRLILVALNCILGRRSSDGISDTKDAPQLVSGNP